MSALAGVPVADLHWLVQSGVGAFLNMPPSALFSTPAEVSAQTFLNASRNFLWRLGFATISKSDARMLLNSARLWAKVHSTKFAALPVVEPVWSAEMEEAEMAKLVAEVEAEEEEEKAAAAKEKAATMAAKAGEKACPECSKVFVYRGAFTTHMRDTHLATVAEANEITVQIFGPGKQDGTIKSVKKPEAVMKSDDKDEAVGV